MTGTPGRALAEGWDERPSARSCTPQACAFRNHQAELTALGAPLYGVSTRTTAEQREAAGRLHLPYPLLSDLEFRLAEALNFPILELSKQRFLKRITLINENGAQKVFYPAFPPDRNADEVVRYLAAP